MTGAGREEGEEEEEGAEEDAAEEDGNDDEEEAPLTGREEEGGLEGRGEGVTEGGREIASFECRTAARRTKRELAIKL